MIRKRIQRASLSSAAALALLAGVSAAQAEIVSYDFTALIDSADATELSSVGLPASGELTGSFTYDSSAGWWGGSNIWADPSLDLTIDQMPASTRTSGRVQVQYYGGEFLVHEDAYDSSYAQVGAQVQLSGQNIANNGTLPSSLSLGGGSAGLLQIFIGGDFSDVDLSATLTSLVRAGAAQTPELDPASGAAAFVLLLGGAALMAGERRRRSALQLS